MSKAVGYKKQKFALITTLVIGGLLAIFLSTELGSYLLAQAKGQLSVIVNTEKIETLKTRGYFSEEQLNKITLIEAAKQFCEDSLGFDKSDSYTSYYEQNGAPILWMLTASQPYKLESYSWWYPVLGSLDYRGYFDKKLAVKEMEALKSQGLDTDLGEVSAWSTLGILADPVLSSMLERSEGRLANLIIHELTHGNIYIANDATFNENLATFFGNEGAKQFLRFYFGKNDARYLDYLCLLEDRITFAKFVERESKKLAELYNRLQDESEQEKEVAKQLFMQAFLKNAAELPLHQKHKYFEMLTEKPINNTFFQSYNRYHEQADSLQIMFEEKYGSKLAVMLRELKSDL